jgi:hypothetical protein
MLAITKCCETGEGNLLDLAVKVIQICNVYFGRLSELNLAGIAIVLFSTSGIPGVVAVCNVLYI